MIPLKYIRENSQKIKDLLKSKKVDFDIESLLSKDKEWRELVLKCDDFSDTPPIIAKLFNSYNGD